MKGLEFFLFLVVLFCGSYGSAKTAYSGRFQLLGYDQKCPWPTRFEYSLILNISGMDWSLTWIFLHVGQGTSKQSELVGADRPLACS